MNRIKTPWSFPQKAQQVVRFIEQIIRLQCFQFGAREGAPGGGDGGDFSGASGGDVVDAVANVDGFARRGVELFQRFQQWFGMRFVIGHIVGGDDDIEPFRHRENVQAAFDAEAQFRRNDAEPVITRFQFAQGFVHSGKSFDGFVVPGQVEFAVSAQQFVRNGGHVVHGAQAAIGDAAFGQPFQRRMQQRAEGIDVIGVRHFKAEDFLPGGAKRTQDERRGVDQCAVEIEKNDARGNRFYMFHKFGATR